MALMHFGFYTASFFAVILLHSYPYLLGNHEIFSLKTVCFNYLCLVEPGASASANEIQMADCSVTFIQLVRNMIINKDHFYLWLFVVSLAFASSGLAILGSWTYKAIYWKPYVAYNVIDLFVYAGTILNNFLTAPSMAAFFDEGISVSQGYVTIYNNNGPYEKIFVKIFSLCGSAAIKLVVIYLAYRNLSYLKKKHEAIRKMKSLTFPKTSLRDRIVQLQE